MTAGLLVAHHLGPGLRGIDQPGAVLELRGVGRQQARDKTLAQQSLGRVAAVRVEAESHHRPAIAPDVRDDRDHARGHRTEIDVGVADRGGDGNHDVVDASDAHGARVTRGI